MAGRKSSNMPRMGSVPSGVAVKVTERKTKAINQGVSSGGTGRSNPMNTIKSHSGGKGGGTAC